jgi:hypothetical protein
MLHEIIRFYILVLISLGTFFNFLDLVVEDRIRQTYPNLDPRFLSFIYFFQEY